MKMEILETLIKKIGTDQKDPYLFSIISIS